MHLITYQKVLHWGTSTFCFDDENLSAITDDDLQSPLMKQLSCICDCRGIGCQRSGFWVQVIRPLQILHPCVFRPVNPPFALYSLFRKHFSKVATNLKEDNLADIFSTVINKIKVLLQKFTLCKKNTKADQDFFFLAPTNIS